MATKKPAAGIYVSWFDGNQRAKDYRDAVRIAQTAPGEWAALIQVTADGAQYPFARFGDSVIESAGKRSRGFWVEWMPNSQSTRNDQKRFDTLGEALDFAALIMEENNAAAGGSMGGVVLEVDGDDATQVFEWGPFRARRGLPVAQKRRRNPIVNKRLAKLADAAARRSSAAPAGEKMTEAKARKILENEDYLPWAEVRAAREFLGVKAPTAAEIWAEAQASKAPRRNPATKLPAKTADVRGAARRYMDFTGHAPGVVGEVNIKIPKAVAVIGSCDGILYTTVRDGKTERYIHEFKKADAPTFTVTPDGKGIFLIGGRYDFTERGIVDASDPTSPRKRR